MFTLLLACVSPPLAIAELSAEESATLRAFGGQIEIPHQMEMTIQKGPENSIEIRMLRKLEVNGGLITVIINRPPKHYEPQTESLDLIDEYTLNGFDVWVYKPRDEMDLNVLSARVSRCTETAQIIFKERPDLDEFLMAASPRDC